MYKLLIDRFGNKAGTIVYEQLLHDYGLTNDDTHATGKEHISVTVNPDGSYPGFTVPLEQLQEIKE